MIQIKEEEWKIKMSKTEDYRTSIRARIPNINQILYVVETI